MNIISIWKKVVSERLLLVKDLSNISRKISSERFVKVFLLDKNTWFPLPTRGHMLHT